MPNRPRLAATLCSMLLVLCTGNAAAAKEPSALPHEARIGQPPRPVQLRVEEQAGRTWLRAEKVSAALPIATPANVAIESVVLFESTGVAIVRASDADGRKAGALVLRRPNGRLEIPWVGALDLRGDLGERRADAIEISERQGKDRPEIVVGSIRERVRICGRPRTLLAPRKLDPRSMTLRPVLHTQLESSPSLELGTDTGARPPAAPVLHALRVVSVSGESGAAAHEEADATTTALTDGDPATYWSAEGSGGGRGAFATFAWEGEGHAIRALSLVPVPTQLPREGNVSSIRALWLLGDDGTRVRLRVPAAPEPGRRYAFVFDKPLAASCVSLLVEDSAPLRGSGAGPALLAEVEAYTDLDTADGLARLIHELDGTDGEPAARLLSNFGPAVALQLARAWPGLGPAGRRRAVHILARTAERDAAARETLALALGETDPDLHRAGLAALLVAGPAGRSVLVPWIAKSGERGDAIALALARRAAPEAIGALLAAVELPGGSERPILRDAIAEALRSGSADVLAAVRDFIAAPSAALAARASVALGLSHAGSVPAAQELAARLLSADFARVETFQDQWRLVQAARALPAASDVDTWLASLATHAERWMLRAAALDALRERRTAQTPPLAVAVLEDPSPRVRVAAAALLGSQPSATAALSIHALHDRWPMVRIAALEALTAQPGASQVLRTGVADRVHQVRAAAIRALTVSRAGTAWPLVERRLRDATEWPDVQAEAVRFAGTLCVRESAPALLLLLERGSKLDAAPSDLDTALLALQILGRLGTETARAANAIAAAPAAPAVLQNAARLQARDTSTCESAVPTS